MTDFRTRFPRNAPPRIAIDEDILKLCSLMSTRLGLSLDRYISEALRRDFSRMQCLAAELPLASLMSRDMIARMAEAAAEMNKEHEKKHEETDDEDPEEYRRKLREAAGLPPTGGANDPE